MAQRAGELCHRVTIQQKTTVYDEYNYETEAWTEVKSFPLGLNHSFQKIRPKHRIKPPAPA